MSLFTWLKLRWARFFTLAGRKWRLSSRPGFDFEVSFPCYHIECTGVHTLLVRVSKMPPYDLQEKYRAFQHPYEAPNPALFGDGPANTYWEMVHGHGGGEGRVENCWTRQDVNWLWEQAAHD